jgi:hypothetical protein
MESANWTKNEEDVINFAGLISYKMYYSESKVPDHIKAYSAVFYHYNFVNLTFDSLPWLTISNFLMLAFDDKKIRFIKTELCEDFAVKGAYLYRIFYSCGDITFYIYDTAVNGYGVQPLDALTKAVVTKNAKTGCGHCGYTGENCSFCANGKLTEAVRKYAEQSVVPAVFLSGDGWQTLTTVLGQAKTDALMDLASFAFLWLTNEDFADYVLKNREDWAEKAKLGEYLHDANIEKYLISGDDEDLFEDLDDDDDDDDY